MKTVVVVDYDPDWPEIFERLRSDIWPVVSDVALAVEHVGSTSVPGLAAKPVIDISVVVPAEEDIPISVARLATLGYVHRGNLGIDGREAFSSPGRLPKHHLYVCTRGSDACVNHLVFRDHLRTHPETAQKYGELKKRLASEFPHDVESYVGGKTDFILEILQTANLSTATLDAIERANRKGGLTSA